MERILRGKYLVRPSRLPDGTKVLTLTGVFHPTNFNVDDVNGNDEMWVSDIIISGGVRFTDSVHTTHSVCSPEEFLSGAHQPPSDFKNKQDL